MPEWVTQPGTIIGLAGLIVAFSIAYVQWRPKRLDYLVTLDRDLAPGAESWKGVSVRINDRTLAHPRLFGVRVANTGRVAIRKEDFEVPLTLRLGGEVVTHRVTGFEPTNLRFFARPSGLDSRSLTIDPTLLNPGDWFEYEVLLDGEPSQISVDGRIAGVRAVRDLTRPDRDWRSILLAVIPFGALLAPPILDWLGFGRPFSTVPRRRR